MAGTYRKVRVIDSHTGGEPTRVVVDGGPVLQGKSIEEKRAEFRDKFDHFRKSIIHEPRGSSVWVGALLTPPCDPLCDHGLIFFNNVGVLGMCGHGTIGVLETLAYQHRLPSSTVKFDTAVGVVGAEYGADRTVSVNNVSSYRTRKDVSLEIEGYGRVVGDVAWAGNWFFLAHQHAENLLNPDFERLIRVTTAIRKALEAQKITGDDGGEIDHIELFSKPGDPQNHSRNFVLCPGLVFDRSPCGTGTSAKLACLAADGKLAPGEIWRQESIIGSVFEASYQRVGNQITPAIKGRAFITAESTLLFDADDPFANGIGI